MAEPDSGYSRLEDQIAWYDAKSGEAQRYFKIGKYVVIGASALVPIAALSGWPIVAAILGATVAIVESVQHVNQWHHNWITYRSTCEALRHEKYTYIEAADPYDNMTEADRRKLLVERIESLISTEHSKWIASNEKAATNAKGQERPSRNPN